VYNFINNVMIYRVLFLSTLSVTSCANFESTFRKKKMKKKDTSSRVPVPIPIIIVPLRTIDEIAVFIDKGSGEF